MSQSSIEHEDPLLNSEAPSPSGEDVDKEINESWKRYQRRHKLNHEELLTMRLTTAAAEGDIQEINFLLGAGVDCNAKISHKLPNFYGGTALHWAKDQSVINTLYQAGADINAIDIFKDTPLVDALLARNPSVAAQLITLGADLNIRNSAGHTIRELTEKYQPELLTMIDARISLEILSSLSNQPHFPLETCLILPSPLLLQIPYVAPVLPVHLYQSPIPLESKQSYPTETKRELPSCCFFNCPTHSSPSLPPSRKRKKEQDKQDIKQSTNKHAKQEQQDTAPSSPASPFK